MLFLNFILEMSANDGLCHVGLIKCRTKFLQFSKKIGSQIRQNLTCININFLVKKKLNIFIIKIKRAQHFRELATKWAVQGPSRLAPLAFITPVIVYRRLLCIRITSQRLILKFGFNLFFKRKIQQESYQGAMLFNLHVNYL